MPSLTPQQHADDTVWEAMKEGFASGGLAMIPSTLLGEIFGWFRYLYVILIDIVHITDSVTYNYYYLIQPIKVYAAMNFSPKFVKVRY